VSTACSTRWLPLFGLVMLGWLGVASLSFGASEDTEQGSRARPGALDASDASPSPSENSPRQVSPEETSPERQFGSESELSPATDPESPQALGTPWIFPTRLPATLDAPVPGGGALPVAGADAAHTDAPPSGKQAPERPRRAAGTPLEIRTPEDSFSARLGSQAVKEGGLLGRYDGVVASKTLANAARLSVLGGFPTTAADAARFDLDRSFYALSVDLAPFDESLTGRLFGVQQRIDAAEQRRSVGGEFGFDASRGFGLVTVDYNLDFRELGAVSLLATTQLDDQTTLNAAFDARRYTNAQASFSTLRSPSVGSVGQLLDKLSQVELRAPSFDASTQTRTLSLGASRRLTTDLELAADVTLKDIIPQEIASSRSTAMPIEQLDYALRATLKDFWLAKSSTTASLRVAERAESRRYSGTLSSQIPVWSSFRVGPDLAVDFLDVEEQWTYKPSMRFEYLRDRMRIDFRLGLEINDYGLGRNVVERSPVVYKVGYRYDF